MENIQRQSNKPTISSKEKEDSKKNYSSEYLDFAQQMFTLVEKFKNLKYLIYSNNLKSRENQGYYFLIDNENKNINYNNLNNNKNTGKKKENFNFKNIFKNFNLKNKIPFYNTIINYRENLYFQYIQDFFNSPTICGRSPIKSPNFYHYTTEAWLLTVFTQLKNSFKSDGNSLNNKPNRNFKDLFIYIKKLKLNEQLFLKNLEIILGTYDLKDNIIKVSEFKLSQHFLIKLKYVLESKYELTSSFKNLKIILKSQNQKSCCLEDLFNFNLYESENFNSREKLNKALILKENASNDYQQENLNQKENVNFNNNSTTNNENLLSSNNFIDNNEEIFFFEKNFELTKSGFLYLIKDILDKVLNYTLNELDSREKNKDSSNLYNTYHSLMFSKKELNKIESDNQYSFFSIYKKETEEDHNLNFSRTSEKSLKEQHKEKSIFSDSKNKIPFESFCKELKRYDFKLNNLSEFSNINNQTIYTINNVSSIANDFSEAAAEENSMNSFTSEADLLNPNQTFYEYAITDLDNFFEDIDLITLNECSFYEKIKAFLKNNIYCFKKNSLNFLENNCVLNSMKYLFYNSCCKVINFQKFFKRNIFAIENSISKKTWKMKYSKLKNWINQSVKCEFNMIKNFGMQYSINLSENLIYYKNNLFIIMKNPKEEIKNLIKFGINFIKENIFMIENKKNKKGNEALSTIIDNNKTKKLNSNEEIEFLSNPIYSLVTYLVSNYKKIYNGKALKIIKST